MTATAEDTRLRGRARWSMTARCARMAAYALVGETPEEPDEDTKHFWIRGKYDETWWIENKLAPKVGGLQNIIREKAVPWPNTGLPVGELHQDAYVIPEKMPYEIKSHFDGSIMDSDYLQAKGEIYFDEDIPTVPDEPKVGALVVINRNLKWEAVPIFVTDEDVIEIEARAAAVIHAGKTGELPARVCEKKGDARGKLCPFAEKCFAGVEKLDPKHLDGDIGLLAIELMHVQNEERAARKIATEAEGRRKEIAERLAAYDLEPGVEYNGAGVKVKRTHVNDVEWLSFGKLKKAGALTDDLEAQLRPFIKPSGAHDRWTIQPSGDGELVDADFGDEAPW